MLLTIRFEVVEIKHRSISLWTDKSPFEFKCVGGTSGEGYNKSISDNLLNYVKRKVK